MVHSSVSAQFSMVEPLLSLIHTDSPIPGTQQVHIAIKQVIALCSQNPIQMLCLSQEPEVALAAQPRKRTF